MFVATDGDAILGVACVTSCGEVTLNYVSPDVRFRGVSKALLQRLEAKAAELGNDRCALTSTGTARLFCLSAGYEEQGLPKSGFFTNSSCRMAKGSAGHSPSLSINGGRLWVLVVWSSTEVRRMVRPATPHVRHTPRGPLTFDPRATPIRRSAS